jgi:hypothetical protein
MIDEEGEIVSIEIARALLFTFSVSMKQGLPLSRRIQGNPTNDIFVIRAEPTVQSLILDI